MKNLLIITSLISLNAFGMNIVKKSPTVTIPKTKTPKKEPNFMYFPEHAMVAVPKIETLIEKFNTAELTDFADDSANWLHRVGGQEVSCRGLEFGIHSAVTNHLKKQYPIIDTETDALTLKKRVRQIIFQQNI